MSQNQLIKGTLKTIILKLLSENNRLYGYEITQRVKELTLGKLEITEGALYPTLHQLEKEMLISSSIESYGKRKRKYYSISKSGLECFQERIDDFQDFLQIMYSVLSPNIDFNFNSKK